MKDKNLLLKFSAEIEIHKIYTCIASLPRDILVGDCPGWLPILYN
jgi:hypothetical protein